MTTDEQPRPNHLCEGIVEVFDVGTAKANFYLSHGYRLLSIQPYSAEGVMKDGHSFLRKFSKFIVGRPEGIERVVPPERERPPEVATETV